ncbi:MAG: serine/threonine protein kinase [Holophagales bacterium]|nr:serine/threonine protein kinase [Holophagales bacterium]
MERIGRGNFGTVYRARHLELQRDVAVKLLLTQVAHDEEAVARFRIEGRAAVRIQHPNAVTVFDFGVTPEGVAFLVMELLAGEPLSEEITRHSRLLPHRVNQVLQPVCSVLDEAHRQGLVHRDIKPENVFLKRDGDGGETVKLLDFGIAKLVGERVSQDNLTAEGFVLGTPAYMAPERLRNLEYDGRSDVYSLGIMLFQMLTGKLPFEPNKDDPMALLLMHVEQDPPKPRDRVPSLSTGLEELVLRCLTKRPEQRPTATELSRELDRLLPTESVAPPEPAEEADPRLDEDRPTTQIQPENRPGSGGADGGVLSRLRGFFRRS